MSLAKTFDELLNVFWLRPETALWREIDIRAMHPFEFRSPSLDMGCGDGIFSFIRAGGEFGEEFDAFRSMSNIGGFFENVDVFDAFGDGLRPRITSKPRYQIDWALDHKENLLKKACELNFYRNMKVADANNSLPFPDESFNSIFSNIVYWLDNPNGAISEISRILRPGGRVCLMLPNYTLPEFSFYNRLHVKTADPRWSFLEKLDRGRFSDNIRQSKASVAWERVFSDAGLRVVEHKMHLSKVVIQVWDVGFRPMFPVLLKMANSLPSEKFLELKREWIENLKGFLLPLVEMDSSLSAEDEPAFHCYILEK